MVEITHLQMALLSPMVMILLHISMLNINNLLKAVQNGDGTLIMLLQLILLGLKILKHGIKKVSG